MIPQGSWKIEYTVEKNHCPFVSNFSQTHEVQGKENTQKGKETILKEKKIDLKQI